jgi:hypothetical protein
VTHPSGLKKLISTLRHLDTDCFAVLLCASWRKQTHTELKWKGLFREAEEVLSFFIHSSSG